MITIETKDNVVINITNIVFNDKLKDFIIKTKKQINIIALISSTTIKII
jgi:hypothetical protein